MRLSKNSFCDRGQGKVSEAIELYEQSLEIQKAIGNQHGIAVTLASIAQLIAIHQGDFDTAFDYLQQSNAILRHIGSPVADQVVEIIQSLQRPDPPKSHLKRWTKKLFRLFGLVLKKLFRSFGLFR